MDSKKKLTGYSKLLLFLLFTLFFVNSYTTCNAVTINDYQLTDEIMQDVVDQLGLGSYYSGDFISNLTNNFNTIMRTVRARGDYHLVTLADVMILGNYTNPSNSGGKDLQVIFFDWREGYNNDDSTLETFTPYIPFNGNTDGQTISGTKQIFKWDGWTYDSSNNINGVTTISQFQFWRFSNTSISNPTTTLTVHQPTFFIRNTAVGMNKAIIFDNYRNDGKGYVQIASRTTNNGYGFYLWVDNILYLEDYGTTLTPTPTGTGTPTPTGTGTPGGSDLTNIENGISNIQNSLTTTPSGDDFITITSGDMLSALDLPAIDDPTANFWLSITDGLTTALTCPNNTSIQIPLIGATFTANSSDFELPDGELKRLIRMACVVGFVLVEYKLIRKIIAYFSSGVFKQIFNAYSRMDISDLF